MTDERATQATSMSPALSVPARVTATMLAVAPTPLVSLVRRVAPEPTEAPQQHAAAQLLERVHERLRRLPHPVRVATITLIGAVLVVAGIAMLVLPGPGLVVLFAGVAVLSTEFPWASRLLHRMTALGARAWGLVRPRLSRLRRRSSAARASGYQAEGL